MSIYIIATFELNRAPATGLSPTITIYDLSDNSVVVNAAPMAEVGSGGYKYLFSAYDATKNYFMVANAATDSVDNRYAYAGDALTTLQVNIEADTALSDYDAPTKTEMDTAFTEIKGATWSASTDTLEHIRDKEIDIETDTQDLQTQIGTAGAGLTNLGGMSSTMKSQVNAEVLDVMNVDTHAEPGQGAPAATTSIFAKINYLYKRWRNKYTETEMTSNIYNDAGDTIDQKAVLSDDGTTFTKSEYGTGA